MSKTEDQRSAAEVRKEPPVKKKICTGKVEHVLDRSGEDAIKARLAMRVVAGRVRVWVQASAPDGTKSPTYVGSAGVPFPATDVHIPANSGIWALGPEKIQNWVYVDPVYVDPK